MCDPVTIAFAVASAAGGALNSYESNQTRNNQIEARNAATMRELERQNRFGAQTSRMFDSSLDKFQPENQAAALTKSQGTVAKAFESNAPTTAEVGSIGTGSGPRVVNDSATKSVGDAFTRNADMSKALGNVAGWDQRAFGNNINLNSTNRDLSRVSDFARTSAGVNGLEQTAAYNNAYRPNSGIGDLLQFAGSVGGYSAGKGSFNTAGAPSTGMNPWAGTVKAPYDANPYG